MAPATVVCIVTFAGDKVTVVVTIEMGPAALLVVVTVTLDAGAVVVHNAPGTVFVVVPGLPVVVVDLVTSLILFKEEQKALALAATRIT